MIQHLTQRELVWLFAFFIVCTLGMMLIFYSVSVAHGNTLDALLNTPTTVSTTTQQITTTVVTTVVTTTATYSVGDPVDSQASMLSGYVKGRDGLVIPDSYVYLHAGSLVFHTQASSSGYYQFNADKDIPSGTYQIRASTEYPESVGFMSTLTTILLQVGVNGYDVLYTDYPPITTVPTTVTTTTAVVTTTPETPFASIYVNVCPLSNYALTGISWQKTGTNGQWLPMMASGLRLSGNLSAPTRLNITQFPSLGYPDTIVLKLAGTDLSCNVNLELNTMFEINMCGCSIKTDPQYNYLRDMKLRKLCNGQASLFRE